MDIDIIRYQDEIEYINAYLGLLREIYAPYPLLAEARAREAMRNLNKDNPFLRHGEYTNYLLMSKGRPEAHMSAIIDRRLPSSIGIIGCFEFLEREEHVVRLFDEVRKFLAARGKDVVRAPLNFTTWQMFRLSYPDWPLPFVTEPFTRGYYRDFFKKNGFKVVQQNVSTISDIEQTEFSSFEKDLRRLEGQGFVFEVMNQERSVRFMHDIYYLTGQIFSDTWSFVAIDFDEFEYITSDTFSALDMDFVHVVRTEKQKPVAFCFSIPDTYLKSGKRVVLKTIGVLPEYQGKGIAKALLFLLYRASRAKKIRQLISSTMRLDNKKMQKLMKSAAATLYREYEVYEMRLPSKKRSRLASLRA
jgi:ribosomal protein S18 acetylase RimI-like enzyme